DGEGGLQGEEAVHPRRGQKGGNQLGGLGFVVTGGCEVVAGTRLIGAGTPGQIEPLRAGQSRRKQEEGCDEDEEAARHGPPSLEQNGKLCSPGPAMQGDVPLHAERGVNLDFIPGRAGPVSRFPRARYADTNPAPTPRTRQLLTLPLAAS